MADLKKRITSLTEKTTLTSGDFAAVDNTSGGTKKFNLYQLTQSVTDNTASIDSLDTAVDGLTSDMAGKADADGSYEGMTAGNAEQLLSDVYTEDKEPYKYRASFSGDREFDEIVGGTVAWNQIISKTTFADCHSENGLTSSWQDEATFKITGTASTTSWIYAQRVGGSIPANNHVYLFTTDNKPTGTRFGIIDGNGGMSNTGNDTIMYALVKNTVGIRAANFRCVANVALDFTAHLNGIDLTQMFGSTIADYILAQEQATAGAGVALAKKWGNINKDYFPYNAGELISVSGLSAHEMVGLNQWDEEWENGYYSRSTGAKATSDTTYIRSKNYIPCFPSTKYFVKVPAVHASNTTYFAVLYYDENHSFLNAIQPSAYNPTAFTTPANAHYMTFYCEIGVSGSTYKHDICININSDRNGEYEPYQKHSYPLDSSLTLRGIPKLADGKMYFDGDTYQSDGTVTRKYAVVDMGSLTWSQPRTSEFRAMISTIVPTPQIAERSSVKGNIICSKYPTVTADETYQQYRGVAISANQATGYISVYDSTYTDAAAFKTAMSGVYLVYELATATTETAEPFTNPQIVSEYGTEEYVSTTICPVGHNTKYPENLRKKIEGLPWDLSMIAPIENGTTASKAYSVGQYFLHNNVFCKAKTAIASGATFTLNTNYTETTVAAEVYTALH